MQRSHLAWPFYDATHRERAAALDAWLAGGGLGHVDHVDVDGACRALVRRLGDAGWLRTGMESRTLCLMRETLAYHDGLADFAFAMQGLGSGAVALAGSDSLRDMVLPRTSCGEWIAAFALSEPDAGSDVGAMQCAARLDGEHYVLDGEKTWISNGGIADVYTVVARTGEAAGSRGLSAFVVTADAPGLTVAERIETMAPHPLARLRFDRVRVPVTQLVGRPGEGFKVAMRTLDVFRASVAAAAIGFARRAMDEAVAHARGRRIFGQALADFQLTQAAFGDMATEIDSAALLTARAAWLRDVAHESTTSAAAMAKLAATEGASRVIDRAVQMFGGRGVTSGEVVERLYREIRALRIYEGASEVQRLIIARELLRA